MITNLTPKQIKNGRAFMVDLRANPKKATGRMRDNDGGRCCLCVAYDTAISRGAELPAHTAGEPPIGIREVYGW